MDIVGFIISGMLGALLYLLCWTKSPRELLDYQNYRRLIIGAIVGYVYFFLHTRYDFPNSVMAVVAGYMGTDFVESFVERFRPFKQEK